MQVAPYIDEPICFSQLERSTFIFFNFYLLCKLKKYTSIERENFTPGTKTPVIGFRISSLRLHGCIIHTMSINDK